MRRTASAYPEEDELQKLRAEFVRYQFEFHQFSDHHTIVAMFAQKKVSEALAATPSTLAEIATLNEEESR